MLVPLLAPSGITVVFSGSEWGGTDQLHRQEALFWWEKDDWQYCR